MENNTAKRERIDELNFTAAAAYQFVYVGGMQGNANKLSTPPFVIVIFAFLPCSCPSIAKE